MNYKKLIIIFFIFLLTNCNQNTNKSSNLIKLKTDKKYRNIGFALIYDEKLKDIKKLDSRSLSIYHKFLRKKSMVKITNLVNGNSLIAEVKSNKVEFPKFYNSILSSRIAETLELDFAHPYVEIILISNNSTFIAKKTKMFEEEKTVAEKAPVDGIQINDLNEKKTNSQKTEEKFFSYSIKVADFYYEDTAKAMIKRINKETSLNNLKIIKLSQTKYRVLIGPFNDIKSLKRSFDKMNIFNFENLEILKNV